MTYYDDNFGQWNMDSEGAHSFYMKVQRRSVAKVCARCERTVRILPEYAYCNRCADAIEQGW